MKNVIMAAVAVAVFGLAGCAKDDKMMKDDAMMSDDAMMKDEVVQTPANSDTVPTKAADTTPGGTGVAEVEPAETSDPNVDLCYEKGGTVGEWPGEDGGTQICETSDGNQYPLASLYSYEVFQ